MGQSNTKQGSGTLSLFQRNCSSVRGGALQGLQNSVIPPRLNWRMKLYQGREEQKSLQPFHESLWSGPAAQPGAGAGGPAGLALSSE